MSLATFASIRPQANVFHGTFATSQFGAGIDRRQQRRARANWACRLVDAASVVNSGQVCDVSEEGFGVMSAVNMPVGSLLDVCLAVPRVQDGARSVPVRCKVRVVACSFVGERSRLGVQFLALPKEARIAIRSYVLSHS
jgi:hypothetical protein